MRILGRDNGRHVVMLGDGRTVHLTDAEAEAARRETTQPQTADLPAAPETTEAPKPRRKK